MWKDILSKLLSRKFIIALTSFITSLLVTFNVEPGTIEQVTSIITACASALGYIFIEGYIDARAVNGKEDDKIEEAKEHED